MLASGYGHHDRWCYLPLAGFVSFDGEPEQYLVAAVLRPGNAAATLGPLGFLRRLVERLTNAFPKASILVRLDGGYACPEVFEFLEDAGLDYVIAMGSNSVLKRHAEPLMKKARRLSRASGQTEHVYGECRCQAGTWNRKHRVIIKAEVVRHPDRDPNDNPRFVVTGLPGKPQVLYERVSCERGEIENRANELHHRPEIDRTRCSRFWANQFRVLMTAAAYVLMQELRLRAAGTSCAGGR